MHSSVWPFTKNLSVLVLFDPKQEELKRLEDKPGAHPRERSSNTLETLTLDESGTPLLIRDDVWGWQ